MRSFNRFLPAFGDDVELIKPALRAVTLRAGQTICEAGERIEHAYFLHDGAVSKLAPFEDGGEIECALIGREGAVGVLAAMGLTTAVTRDVCHMTSHAWMIERRALVDASRRSTRIHDVLDRYCGWKLGCAIRYGACNARHSVTERLGRWLLTCSDVLESDDIALSQDVFAKMLGVQRSSINAVLQHLRAGRVISLTRGNVKIIDRGRLRAIACECYGVIRELEDELFRDLGIEPRSREAPGLVPRRNGSDGLSI